MSDHTVTEQEISDAIAEFARIGVEKLKTVFTTPPLDKTWEEIEKSFKAGESLKSICEISDDYMDETYNEAKERFERNDFETARDGFLKLCLFEQKVPKYWGGLGKCYEALKLYNEAASAYRMLLFVTGGNEPLPYLCLGYCHIKQNDLDNALEILEAGRDIADPNDDATRPVTEQIEELLAAIKK